METIRVRNPGVGQTDRRQDGELTAEPTPARRVFLTCEHADNKIPEEYRALFRGRHALLNSHRGYDIGALDLAQTLQEALQVPLFFTRTTRLLVDLNRSRRNRTLFSELSRDLDRREKEQILAKYYQPHRQRVEAQVASLISEGHRVLQVALHSFTPVLHGVQRKADIGILYDPAVRDELELCAELHNLLSKRLPDLAIRRNYPYRGAMDSHPTYIRQCVEKSSYLGVEIEVNQRLAVGPPGQWLELKEAIADAVKELAAQGVHRPMRQNTRARSAR